MEFILEPHKWKETLMHNKKMELKNIDIDELSSFTSQTVKLNSIKDKGVDYYLTLWQSVGKEWNWSSRLRLSKQEIQQKVFDNDNVIVNEIVNNNNEVVGIAEYKIEKDSVQQPTSDGNESIHAEIMFFGLNNTVIGKGIGKQALMLTLKDIIIQKKIQRVILQTCQLDSSKALSFYEKSGFEIFRSWSEMENIIYYDIDQE